MHELPITESLLDLVLENAARADAASVTDVCVVLGELSGFSAECIQSYWEPMARGTVAEGARLHFEHVPLSFECRDCGRRFEPEGASFACVHCGGSRVRVAGGQDLRLASIDVVSADEALPVSRKG